MKSKLIIFILTLVMLLSATACSGTKNANNQGGAIYNDTQTNYATVTLVYNNGQDNSTMQVAVGDKALKPANPTKTDRYFKGWYCNGLEYNWDSVVSQDITVQALWTENASEQAPKDYATFTIIYNNGNAIVQEQIEKGTKYTKPSNPTFGENIFLGWYSKGVEYNWDSLVYQDTTVQALWQKVYKGGLKILTGSTTAITNGYKNAGGNLMLANNTDNFDRGTLSVDVTSPTASDSGIMFCVTDNGMSSYWEQGVSYYFFFISQAGHAYLAKVDYGKWTALTTVAISGYTLGNTYNVKIVLNGTTISCYVNNQLYINYSEFNFLTGTGYGLRTAVNGVSFANFKISNNV